MTKRFPYSRIALSSALCIGAVFLTAIGLGAGPRFKSQTGNSNGSWTVVHSPNRTSQSLSRVTCLSAADCWAVGTYTKTDGDEYAQTLIEHWNGSSWTIVPSPNASWGPYKSSSLEDITCTSANDCWAVGTFADYDSPVPGLIEHWNGTSWALVDSPHTGSTRYRLRGVACSTATNCWAVGYTYDDWDSTYTPLVEQWNGSSWSIINSPAGFISSITCSSATGECWVLGESFIHWNGNAWSVLSPSGVGQDGAFLASLTCASSTDCWAIDSDNNQIQHWNGVAWTNTGGGGPVEHIACASSANCWAVGSAYDEDFNLERTLIEHWNGSSWSVVTSPNIENNSNNSLHDIVCTSATQCWAVGSNGGYSRGGHALVEKWDGAAWAIAPSADATGGGIYSFLNDVACVSLGDCWAVGSLIAHWDGNSWTMDPAEDGPRLIAVACTSATDCWAVGERSISYNVSRTFVKHWNGSTWSIVDSPNGNESIENRLHSISCSSASDCWALGRASDEDGKIPGFRFAEHWDGNSWSIVPLPSAGNPGGDNYFSDITCSSSSDCWIVGTHETIFPDEHYIDETLIVHWNGSSWTIVSSPNYAPERDSWLSGVTCVAAADCWAVGNLITHWDGTSWSPPIAPDIPWTVFDLSDISCTSATNCWAIDSYTTMHWDGSLWSPGELETTAYPWSYEPSLRAVSCLSESRCWAVGAAWKKVYSGGQNYYYEERTLIDQFTPKPPLLNTVSRLTQGGAGPYDVDLTMEGMPTVECRRGGPNNDFTLVFTFADAISGFDDFAATAIEEPWNLEVPATVTIGADPHQLIVNLRAVPNARQVNVWLQHVRDAAGNVANFSQSTGFLIGDTNGDGQVNSADIAQTKSQSGRSLTNANFREDLNADGAINSADVSLVKSRSGTAIPPPPPPPEDVARHGANR